MLARTVNELLSSSITRSTRVTYTRAWVLACDFFLSVFHSVISLPLTPTQIALFVAFLYNKGMSASSISTYLSAMGFLHKINGMSDPTDSFLTRKLVVGLRRKKASFDLRLPITQDILYNLLDALPHTCSSAYNRCLFSAMFLLAFSAYLRVGEMTSSPPLTENNIALTNIVMYNDSMKLSMYRYKHHYTGLPHVMHITGDSSARHCPVQAMVHYLAKRGATDGALFILRGGNSVSRAFFHSVLKRALIFCNLDCSRYKGHSFRIGAATAAMLAGLSDEQIRHLGRWHSDAFRRYIRP